MSKDIIASGNIPRTQLAEGVYFYKTNNVVTLTIESATVTTSGWTVLATLPEGCRPKTQIYGFMGYGNYSSTPITCWIQANGVIAIGTSSSSGVPYIWGSMTFAT